MTPEALDLTRRIAAAEAALEAEQDAWDELAAPLYMARDIGKALGEETGEWSKYRIANRALKNLPDRPVESYGLAGLKGRLERLVAA